MGSVLDYIDCPHCGQEAYGDFYYKTGEEYINCQHCGYHYSYTFKCNDEGKYITKDGTEDYSLDNMIIETNELKNPYGAYKIKYYDSPAIQCGSLENETDCVALMVNIEKHENVETCSISRFVNGEIIKISVIDNGPKEAK